MGGARVSLVGKEGEKTKWVGGEGGSENKYQGTKNLGKKKINMEKMRSPEKGRKNYCKAKAKVPGPLSGRNKGRVWGPQGGLKKKEKRGKKVIPTRVLDRLFVEIRKGGKGKSWG